MNNIPFSVSKSTMKILILIGYLLLTIIVSPLSIAIFCAYIVYPFVNFCNKKLKIPFALSVLLISLSFFYLIYVLIHLTLQSSMLLLPLLEDTLVQYTNQQPSNLLSTLFNDALSMADKLVQYVFQLVQQLFQYFLELIIFIMAFYFSLFESRRNRFWFFLYTPKLVREDWKRYFSKAMDLFTRFLFVEVRLFLLTFILLCIGFMLLKFDHAILKAFLISVCDALPFFGIGFVLVPLAIYYFFTGNTLFCVAIIVIYIIIQTTRQLTESYLWASTFHLRTVHSFVISAASVLVFGFYGILLSPFFLLLAVKLKEKSIFAR
ncbi:AI-2E family transporter [Lysinibacillus sp. 54212]|uniref:AI-2E family transporter n=1 Tax=Lysinibacillus sp. 54212 TaxID=3119829 RepID=UPI002FCA9DCE